MTSQKSTTHLPCPFGVTIATALNTLTPGLWGFAKPLILAEITMSTSRKLKSHGMRRGKNRAPHKGVKRGGSKRKYRKGSLKSRKRGDDANRSYRSHL
ncbi:spermatid nuclear transition protein 1 [Marmota marmota marmota]|nr:spermatid nuclear transition protein 1 [Marmota marmota marmota]